jgi:hypothetical protein
MRRPGYLGKYSGTLSAFGQNPQQPQQRKYAFQPPQRQKENLATKNFRRAKQNVRGGLRMIPLLGLGKKKKKSKLRIDYQGNFPPPNPYGLVPQFYPPVAELMKMHPNDPEAQEREAMLLNANMKKDILALVKFMNDRVTLAQQVLQADAPKAQEAATKTKDIATELGKLHKWVKRTGSPFTEVPMLPSYEHALFTIHEIKDNAYDPLLDEEKNLDKMQEPTVVPQEALAPPQPTPQAEPKGMFAKLMDMLGL